MVEDFSNLQRKIGEDTGKVRALLDTIESKNKEKKDNEDNSNIITQDINKLQRSKDPKDIQKLGEFQRQSQSLRTNLAYINSDLRRLKSQAIQLRSSNPDLVKIFPQLRTIN